MDCLSQARAKNLWVYLCASAAMAFLAPLVGYAFIQLQDAAALDPSAASDPVSVLERKIRAGEVNLSFDPDRGYLPSVLEQLDIPESSQALVFSKSSFQQDRISPAAPRALYFNDDTYVGWVQGGDFVELIAVDPRSGPLFFTLGQQPEERPLFQRQTTACLLCHESLSPAALVPGLLMLSVLPDANGHSAGLLPYPITAATPLAQRWAGWYVSGTHGEQRHMGNVFVPEALPGVRNSIDDLRSVDFDEGANLIDLNTRFDTRPYPSSDSDIVALMVLAHQTHVHNLIARASQEVRTAMDVNSGDVRSVVQSEGDVLVRGLFVEAVPLSDRVSGTSNFAAEFASRGLRDRRRRSLRDLDLEDRLFRYPLSYLVYSDAFDAMPGPLRDYVYQRFGAVLSGEDTSPDFDRLSSSDRRAIYEILSETKSDFAAFSAN